MRRKQEDNLHITIQHKDFLKMSTSRADTVSFRSWVSNPRNESGFPFRNSNYINNTKHLHRINVATSLPRENRDSNQKSLVNRSMRFPVTSSRNQQQQKREDWWQFVMANTRPVVTVQDILLHVKTEPSNLNKYRGHRFQKKVLREGLTCTMFKDNDKILYFRNSVLSDTKKVDTIVRQDVSSFIHAGCHKDMSFVHDSDIGFPKRHSFIRTNNKAILHSRSFYLKTPITKSGKFEIGATSNCKCRSCLLENEKLDTKHSIQMRLINTNPGELWSSTSSCPPSRPNSMVDVRDE